MGVSIYELFLTKECVEKIRDSEYNISELREYFLISEKVAKKMSSVETNQGAFAVAKNLSFFNINNINENDFVLALVEIRDPGNLGTLLRSALSFGFLKVILVDCCEIYNEKFLGFFF